MSRTEDNYPTAPVSKSKPRGLDLDSRIDENIVQVAEEPATPKQTVSVPHLNYQVSEDCESEDDESALKRSESCFGEPTTELTSFEAKTLTPLRKGLRKNFNIPTMVLSDLGPVSRTLSPCVSPRPLNTPTRSELLSSLDSPCRTPVRRGDHLERQCGSPSFLGASSPRSQCRTPNTRFGLSRTQTAEKNRFAEPLLSSKMLASEELSINTKESRSEEFSGYGTMSPCSGSVRRLPHPLAHKSSLRSKILLNTNRLTLESENSNAAMGSPRVGYRRTLKDAGAFRPRSASMIE